MFRVKRFFIIGGLVLMPFLFAGNAAYGITTLSEGTSIKGNDSASPSVQQLTRMTLFMDKIEKNILYLKNGKTYALTGVRVLYQATPKGEVSRSGRIPVAEMIFVDGMLKEVVVH